MLSQVSTYTYILCTVQRTVYIYLYSMIYIYLLERDITSDTTQDIVSDESNEVTGDIDLIDIDDIQKLDVLRRLDYDRFNYARSRLAAVRAERLVVGRRVKRSNVDQQVGAASMYNSNNANNNTTPTSEYTEVDTDDDYVIRNANNSSNHSKKDVPAKGGQKLMVTSLSSLNSTSITNARQLDENPIEMDSSEEEIERKIAEKERVVKMRDMYSRALRVNQAHSDRTQVDNDNGVKSTPKIIGDYRVFVLFANEHIP